MSPPRHLCAAIALGLVAALAVGCAGGDDEPAGSVRVSGSTTLLPMISSIAGRYAAEHPLVDLGVRMTGTADGFALFCDGMVDVTGASREMTARERETCIASDIQFLRLVIAHDAVVLFTSGGAAAPTCLTREQIYALLGPESVGVDTWTAAATILPGAAEGLPAEPFVAVGPGSGSGTRQLLLDLAIEPIAEQRDRDPALRGDYVAESSEQLIVDRLAGGTGLGFAGLATASQWGSRVRLLAVDGDDGCVAPELEAIRTARYPLSRLLYLYVNVDVARDDAALASLVDAVLADEGLATAAEVGGVALGGAQAEEQRAAWARALAGGAGS